MIRMLLFASLFPSVLAAAILHWAAVRQWRARPFGVRVSPEYAVSQEAARQRSGFLARLWVWTAVACGLAFVAMQQGRFGAAAFAPVVMIAGASVAFARAWSVTKAHAVAPGAIRVATIAPEERRLPGGLPAVLGPFVILAAVALYLNANWDRIPVRFPIHWGLDGKPNGWSSRSIAGVYWPLLLAAAIQAMMLGMAWATGIDARRAPVARATRRVLVVTAWFIAGVFSFVTLTPLLPGPPPIWLVLGATVAFVIYAVWTTSKAAAQPSEPDNIPEDCWRWGQFYYNPDDPALFVEKRFGIGMTLNFARPAAWAVLVGFLVLPLLIVAVTKLWLK